MGNDIVDLTDSVNIGKSGDNRFLQRVFTPPEREVIAAGSDPDVILWALWAAKETAYKIVSKFIQLADSIPRRYPVVLFTGDHGPARSDSVCGMVFSPHGLIAIRLNIAADYLHCIGAASPDVLDHVLWGTDRLPPVEDGDDSAPDGGSRFSAHSGDESHHFQALINEQPEGHSPSCEARLTAFDPSSAVRRQARLRLAELLHAPATDIDIQRHRDIRGWGPPRPYLRGQPAPFDLSLSHDGAFVAYAMLPLCSSDHPAHRT